MNQKHIGEKEEKPISMKKRSDFQSEQLEQTITLLKAYEFDSVLEFGCGYGLLTKKIYDEFRPKRFVAFDLSEHQINNAQKNCKTNEIEFIISTIKQFNPNEKFDLVIGREVLLHVPPDSIRETMLKLCSFSKKFIFNIDPLYDGEPIMAKKTWVFKHNYEDLYNSILDITDFYDLPLYPDQMIYMGRKNSSISQQSEKKLASS